MVSELLRKWFGLEILPPCTTCEVLREQLANSESERRSLLAKLLEKNQPEPLPAPKEEEELTPIRPQFVPWRVRQQMLEAEDRRQAELLRRSKQNVEKLEKEVGVTDASKVS